MCAETLDGESNVNIGDKLKGLRADSGLKAHEVAAKTGILREKISRFENNVLSPTIAELEAMLKVYSGKTLQWFFESRIPAKFAKHTQAEIHESLQAVLEEGDEKLVTAISVMVQTAYDSLRRRPGKKGQ